MVDLLIEIDRFVKKEKFQFSVIILGVLWLSVNMLSFIMLGVIWLSALIS
jgi:hypothetical protein